MDLEGNELHLVNRDLSISCTRSSSKIVKLFDNGRIVDKENVDEENKDGETLLHRVVRNQNVYSPAIVSFLLEKGALVTISGIRLGDKTALHIAIRNMTVYSLDIVKIILENNSTAVHAKDGYGMTPLHWALENEHKFDIEIIRLLLEKGADINPKDNSGRTPLYLAVKNNNEYSVEIVRLLLEKGADTNQKDDCDEMGHLISSLCFSTQK